MHLCLHVCLYVCLYVCIYACMCVCMCEYSVFLTTTIRRILNQVLITSIINVRHYSSHPDQDPYIYHRVSRTCDIRHSLTLQSLTPITVRFFTSFLPITFMTYIHSEAITYVIRPIKLTHP